MNRSVMFYQTIKSVKRKKKQFQFLILQIDLNLNESRLQTRAQIILSL